jgi:uncharacterized membrane protein YhaH (DUF805 family)
MQFPEAIESGFRNYVNFAGRAARSEYWYWILFAVLVAIVSGILDNAFFPSAQPNPLSAVAAVILFLPGVAVGVRRLHDLDRTGWWVLIVFTGIGAILLIIWFCLKGTPGANRFGPDPLAGST